MRAYELIEALREKILKDDDKLQIYFWVSRGELGLEYRPNWMQEDLGNEEISKEEWNISKKGKTYRLFIDLKRRVY